MNWTLPKASTEFGISRETLQKRLAGAEIPKKKQYSTREIVRAVFGDIDSEKLRLVREQADKIALENAESRAELVNATELMAVIERGLSAMVQAVQSASNLENEDKDKIINHLREVGGGVAEFTEHRKATSKAASK